MRQNALMSASAVLFRLYLFVFFTLSLLYGAYRHLKSDVQQCVDSGDCNMRLASKYQATYEPPQVFMIGQDSRGNWIVRDQSGLRGGLFVERAQALRYVRDEAGDHPRAIVMISGAFELDTSGMKRPPMPRQSGVEERHVRRVA